MPRHIADYVGVNRRGGTIVISVRDGSNGMSLFSRWEGT